MGNLLHAKEKKPNTAEPAVSAAAAAEAVSTVPLPCGMFVGAFWILLESTPPYRIGAPDRRQFLGTIKLQPSIPPSKKAHISSHLPTIKLGT